MKTKWAVACAVPIFGALLALGHGCSGTRSQVKEFQRMDVGEGPGEVLTHLIGLQKEPGEQQIVAHPPPAAQGEGSGVPPVPSDYSSDVSTAGLSMSRDTAAMHDVLPAVPPLGTPPLLVQTDVHTAKSSLAETVSPEAVATRYSSVPVPSRSILPPVTESAKPITQKDTSPHGMSPSQISATPPVPTPPPNVSGPAIVSSKSRVPENMAPSSDTPVSSPVPAENPPTPSADPRQKEKTTIVPTEETPSLSGKVSSDVPVPSSGSIEQYRRPVPVGPQKAPTPDIASVKPPVPLEGTSPPVPPAGYYMTLKKGEMSPAVSKKVAPPATARETPPETVTEKVSDYSGGPGYRIGPEDVLHLSVWGNPELTMDVAVRPDGRISLPLIQDVPVEGLTTAEVAAVIRQKLLAYIKEPSVSVMVKEVNATKFYVLGYVARPGTYALRGDVTVLQALSLAGGLGQFASPRKIRLVRNTKGIQEVRILNYYDMIESGDGNYLLMPGDTIVVP